MALEHFDSSLTSLKDYHQLLTIDSYIMHTTANFPDNSEPQMQMPADTSGLQHEHASLKQFD